jgi:hypothetical protein
MPDGAVIDLETGRTGQVAERFDATAIKEALVPDYTLRGLLRQGRGARGQGCLVSLIGKRVLYHGRMSEPHTEYFPGTQPEVGL